jgi:hypothetical protein
MYLHGSMAFTGSESFLTMANTLIHHNIIECNRVFADMDLTGTILIELHRASFD